MDTPCKMPIKLTNSVIYFDNEQFGYNSET